MKNVRGDINAAMSADASNGCTAGLQELEAAVASNWSNLFKDQSTSALEKLQAWYKPLDDWIRSEPCHPFRSMRSESESTPPVFSVQSHATFGRLHAQVRVQAFCPCNGNTKESTCALHGEQVALTDIIWEIVKVVHTVFDDKFISFANLFLDETVKGKVFVMLRLSPVSTCVCLSGIIYVFFLEVILMIHSVITPMSYVMNVISQVHMFKLKFLKRPGWAVPTNDEWKHLNLKADDATTLVRVRSTYIIQLLVTIASGSSVNLKPMFNAVTPVVIDALCDLDACLFSQEALYHCWCAALTDLLAHGKFDVKAVLKGAKLKVYTRLGTQLGLDDAGEPAGDTAEVKKTADDDDNESAVFSWNALMSFGSDKHIPAADDLMRLTLSLQAHLISLARTTENKYRDQMSVFVEQTNDGEGSKKKRGHNMAATKTTILFKLDKDHELLRSASDEKLLFCKLPSDLTLVFFGAVGNLTALRYVMCQVLI